MNVSTDIKPGIAVAMVLIVLMLALYLVAMSKRDEPARRITEWIRALKGRG